MHVCAAADTFVCVAQPASNVNSRRAGGSIKSHPKPNHHNKGAGHPALPLAAEELRVAGKVLRQDLVFLAFLRCMGGCCCCWRAVLLGAHRRAVCIMAAGSRIGGGATAELCCAPLRRCPEQVASSCGLHSGRRRRQEQPYQALPE